jgi:predicted nucleic acid-binding protein
MGFLIDTCIWIDVERGSIAPADVTRYTANEPVFISPVTLAELAFGAEMAVTEPIHQKRLASLNRLRKKPFVIIDNNSGEVFGRLAAYLRREGKDHRYRVQDLWLVQRGGSLPPVTNLRRENMAAKSPLLITGEYRWCTGGVRS